MTHPGSAVGADQDVTTDLACTIVCYHASVEETANTNPGSFFVQISPSSSGDEDWATVATFTATVSTPATEAMTATEASGETSLACASTTGFLEGDKLYIQDAGVLADSEWALCELVTLDASIHLFDGLTAGKDSSDFIWNDADIFTAQLDLTAVGRVRVLFLHRGAVGANCHVKAMMVTGDSIG